MLKDYVYMKNKHLFSWIGSHPSGVQNLFYLVFKPKKHLRNISGTSKNQILVTKIK